jgi:hypothetical protein
MASIIQNLKKKAVAKIAGNSLFLCYILFAALGLRLLMLLTCLNTVNADQAVLGLMGMHILKGKLFIYFWENKYCGAFISYLAAFNFKLFGASVLSFKLATFPWVILSVVYGYKLAAAIYGRAVGLLTALLLAVPPVYIILFSVSPHGTYSETLALGPIILYLTYLISNGEETAVLKTRISLLGFVSGFGCWLSPLITPFLFTSWFVLGFRCKPAVKKQFARYALFFVFGAAPLLIYNLQHPFATFLNLGSRPLDVSKAGLHADLASRGLFLTFLKYTADYLRGLPASFLHVFGNIPGIFKLANPLTEKYRALHAGAAFICLAPAAYCLTKLRKFDRANIPEYLVLFSLLFALFGFLDNPRFLLPLWPAAAIFLAAALVRLYVLSRLLAVALPAAFLGLNLWGGLLCLDVKSPPYPKLAEYLISKGLTRGYAGYWTAYPITFVSGEKVIVSPTLYTGSILAKSKDTYPFYTNIVDAEKDVFYVTNDSAESAAIVEARLKALKINCKTDTFQPFKVYYSFSKRVYPADLDLPASVTALGEPFFY